MTPKGQSRDSSPGSLRQRLEILTFTPHSLQKEIWPRGIQRAYMTLVSFPLKKVLQMVLEHNRNASNILADCTQEQVCDF